MARPLGELTRCTGRWTEARFKSFIKSLLRSGTRRWAPISDVKRKARRGRGFYLCDSCGETVPASIKIEGKRVNNAVVDHVVPVVDPEQGFESWDKVIDRMFCEAENLQLLCHECHSKKTGDERQQAKERREREKNNEAPDI